MLLEMPINHYIRELLLCSLLYVNNRKIPVVTHTLLKYMTTGGTVFP